MNTGKSLLCHRLLLPMWVAVCLLASVQRALGGAVTDSILYRFIGGSGDGSHPMSGLVADAQGNLYGTTVSGGSRCSGGCGTVFQLVPPATKGGTWTENILYTFADGRDGGLPAGSLILDAAGNLYGTATQGGGVTPNCPAGCGVVFMLTPSPSLPWTETVLYSFSAQNGAAGIRPSANLIFDSLGNLYGTTEFDSVTGFGTVFELTPSGGSWMETTLYTFQGGADGAESTSGLIFDSLGNLYGTTQQGGGFGFGAVFELSPIAGGGWTEQVLYGFQGGSDGSEPPASLVFDKAGNLYGSALMAGNTYCRVGCGLIFELTPPIAPGQPWTKTTIYNFLGKSDGQNPYGPLIFDSAGNMYGTTGYGGGAPDAGTVFQLVPRNGSWVEYRYAFSSGNDGNNPLCGLVLIGKTLYGTTRRGGSSASLGTVFSITAP